MNNNTPGVKPPAKERPILFSGPMVRAIIEGRKTQTRRIVTPQPPEDNPPFEVAVYDPLRVNRRTGEQYPGPRTFGVYGDGWDIKCPFGQPGDRLWVRETFWHYPTGETRYRADGCLSGKAWKPSIHMPRKASRITLELTAVRVERLQDISEADAKADGCCIDRYRSGYEPGTIETARIAFHRLWESINGPGSWSENPWVWVVEFNRVTP